MRLRPRLQTAPAQLVNVVARLTFQLDVISTVQVETGVFDGRRLRLKSQARRNVSYGRRRWRSADPNPGATEWPGGRKVRVLASGFEGTRTASETGSAPTSPLSRTG